MAKMNLPLAKALLEEAYLDGWWAQMDSEQPKDFPHRAMKRAQGQGRQHALNEQRQHEMDAFAR